VSSVGFLVSGRVLVQPVLESFKITVSIVLNTGLVVLGVELEGGVAADRDTVHFVNGGIELSNH